MSLLTETCLRNPTNIPEKSRDLRMRRKVEVTNAVGYRDVWTETEYRRSRLPQCVEKNLRKFNKLLYKNLFVHELILCKDETDYLHLGP